MTPFKTVLKHFKKADTRLYKAALSLSPGSRVQIEERMREPVRTKKLFEDLCATIIGQQLSGKAADTIYARFETKCKKVTPKTVAALSLEDLRSVGISYAKGRALHDLAEKVATGVLPLALLPTLDASEIRTRLIAVRGIGPWSAEMMLMFSFKHEDVFSLGDLGLQNACKKLYRLRTHPKREKLEALSKPWVPYRTWAARILWKYLDENKGRVSAP